MRELTEQDEFSNVVKEKDICIVDFFATWCGPCKVLTPILQKISAEYKDLQVVKVDVDKFSDIAEIHHVSSLPTIVFYKNGKLTEHIIKGVHPNTEQTLARCV